MDTRAPAARTSLWSRYHYCAVEAEMACRQASPRRVFTLVCGAMMRIVDRRSEMAPVDGKPDLPSQAWHVQVWLAEWLVRPEKDAAVR